MNCLSVGYIPAKRDIRHVISCGKGQCSSEAEEVPRAKPEVLPRLNESTDLYQGINGSYIPLGRDFSNLYYA